MRDFVKNTPESIDPLLPGMDRIFEDDVIEVVGTSCSGKTSLLLHLLKVLTGSNGIETLFIDVDGSFDFNNPIIRDERVPLDEVNIAVTCDSPLSDHVSDVEALEILTSNAVVTPSNARAAIFIDYITSRYGVIIIDSSSNLGLIPLLTLLTKAKENRTCIIMSSQVRDKMTGFAGSLRSDRSKEITPFITRRLKMEKGSKWPGCTDFNVSTVFSTRTNLTEATIKMNNRGQWVLRERRECNE